MGKTRRYSPEGDDYEIVDHRVRTRDSHQTERLAALSIQSSLPRIKLAVAQKEKQPEVFPAVLPGWVPSRIIGRTAYELYIREQRLSLLEQLGSQFFEQNH